MSQIGDRERLLDERAIVKTNGIQAAEQANATAWSGWKLSNLDHLTRRAIEEREGPMDPHPVADVEQGSTLAPSLPFVNLESLASAMGSSPPLARVAPQRCLFSPPIR